MQFGREPLPENAFAMTADGERGWVCSENPGHFQGASEGPRPEPPANGERPEKHSFFEQPGQSVSERKEPLRGTNTPRQRRTKPDPPKIPS